MQAPDGKQVHPGLEVDALPVGRHAGWIHLGEDGRGAPFLAPLVAIRGERPGPVVGITAAIHGNELNGIPAIHELFNTLPVEELCGTVVAVPVINLPGYLRNQRPFSDGTDLNRIMPGKPNAGAAPLYARRIVDRILPGMEFLMDLHTASFGRINSLYVRADLADPIAARMAYLQDPQIVVNSPGGDGTFRGAAADMGIHAITVEIGDPQRIQRGMVVTAARGMRNVLEELQMVPHDQFEPTPPIVCRRSFWLYTDRGGVLEVLPKLVDNVKEGEVVARVHDLFGELVCEYRAPQDGVVVGKSTNPVAESGARILHLGLLADPGLPRPSHLPGESLARLRAPATGESTAGESTAG